MAAATNARHPYRHARHFLFSYDDPTRLREWLWNDPQSSERSLS
jgi:hypothetical protein